MVSQPVNLMETSRSVSEAQIQQTFIQSSTGISRSYSTQAQLQTMRGKTVGFS
jgi:hypothetical protein